MRWTTSSSSSATRRPPASGGRMIAETVEQVELPALDAIVHRGVHYLRVLAALAAELRPRTYLEIGTHKGDSLKQFPDADAVCVDPGFEVEGDVLFKRPRTFFFQTTSDDFFASYRAQELLGSPIDIAFIDGMHRFENVLRDFIQVEREVHADSLIVLHDCLPPHPAMTWRRPNEREALLRAAPGLPAPPENAWTGDVYKILEALKA